MTNRPNGTLYLGVTSNLPRRAWEHRTGQVTGFTARYGLKELVWYEFRDEIYAAIQREHNMKHLVMYLEGATDTRDESGMA